MPNKTDIHLKYQCLDKFDQIINSCDSIDCRNLLMDMKDLIHYQMNMIQDQRREIVSLKHKDAWKRYDLPDDKFINAIDKPPKSDNMSC